MDNSDKIEGNLENRNEMVITEFADLRDLDLSQMDLRNISIEVLKKADFNTATKWPEQDRLPIGFNPEKVIDIAKDSGLGIQKLHKKGIDGRGIKVAIIDQSLSSEKGEFMPHQEFADNLVDYKTYGDARFEGMSMHGPAVASLFVGKTCGIAPGAQLFYRATPSGYDENGKRNFNEEADALFDIIELNKTLALKDKIRIVSCSTGYMEDEPEPGLERWINAIKIAEEEGIIVSDVGDRTGVDYIGGGASEDKENIDNYNLALFLAETEDKELNKLISEKDVEGILKRLRSTRDNLGDISDSDLREKITERLSKIEEGKENDLGMIVPSDYRTMASKTGSTEYMYNGKGGMSWAVPYLSGIFALVLQVNPDLKKEEIADIINRTASTNKKGLKVINPTGIIEEVKKTVKK